MVGRVWGPVFELGLERASLTEDKEERDSE